MNKFCIILLIPAIVITSAISCSDKNPTNPSNNASTASAGKIVMTTTDYATGNTAFYDIESGTFSDNILPHHQDALVKTDGNFLYIIEGFGADAISKYDSENITAGNEIYQYSVGANSNPRDIVFLDSKAYIILYNSDKILVVNPDASDEESFKIGEIDISQWADEDGSPEPQLIFIYNGMVYVVLQRYNMNTFAAGTSVLIKIDPAADTLADMDGETDGIQGVNLIVKNINMGSLLGSKLYLGGTTYGASEEGVMTIDLDDPINSQIKIISESSIGGNVAGVQVFNDGLGLVFVYDANWSTIPRIFDSATGTLGNTLPVPDAGGGVAMVDGYLYVGSREYGNPGMYIVNSENNTVTGDMHPTELPPYSIIYIE